MNKIFLSILISISSFFYPPSSEVSSIIPGGENIGIEIKSKGVVVIGGYDVVSETEKYNPIKESDIQKGDLIYEVDGVNVENIQDLLDVINSNYKKGYVNLSILRNNKYINRQLKFVKSSSANTIKTGLLVKERILGLGTVTFYDPETKIYGALGHKLVDSDFSSIVDINSGSIFESDVTGIKKSSMGNVGQIIADIDENEKIGNVFLNTDYGIFGYYDICPDKDALQVATHQDVHLGEAYIYTTLNDDDVEKYKIEITSLKKQDIISTKGISFKITDKDLLDKAGGIVQGMSGSPIIQDNKIVGAVTHVLVDSVKKGYGIYIDYMLQTAHIS